MSRKPQNFPEVSRLISDLLDGRIEPAESARLELMLEADADARALYYQMVEQEVEMECLAGGNSRPSVIQFASPGPKSRRPVWVLGIAAALLLFLLLRWALQTPVASQRERASVAATSWSADFESGDLGGWHGAIVTDGLPGGSRFGIRAIETRQAEATIHLLAAPENWRGGLVELTNNSMLHLTYRLGRSPWVNVFIHAMGAEGSPPSMFQLRGTQFPGVADQWQTASIPMRFFRRKVWDDASNGLSFVGDGPRAGERIAALSFSAPHPLDLIIDRIWITPDGGSAEIIQPAP